MFKPVPCHHCLKFDENLCLRVNQAARIEPVREMFRIATRLGNGVFWYTLMGVILACHGAAAIPVVLHRVAAGPICTLLYKSLKAATSRPRPFPVNQTLPAMPGLLL